MYFEFNPGSIFLTFTDLNNQNLIAGTDDTIHDIWVHHKLRRVTATTLRQRNRTRHILTRRDVSNKVNQATYPGNPWNMYSNAFYLHDCSVYIPPQLNIVFVNIFT